MIIFFEAFECGYVTRSVIRDGSVFWLLTLCFIFFLFEIEFILLLLLYSISLNYFFFLIFGVLVFFGYLLEYYIIIET